MSLTHRILPRDEWGKLGETYLAPALSGLALTDAQVVVVEDDGQIVGTWALLTCAHVEGLWIAPSARHRPGVLRRLWKGMRDLTRDRHAQTVITNAETDAVRALLATAGASRIPGDSYLLGLGKD